MKIHHSALQFFTFTFEVHIVTSILLRRKQWLKAVKNFEIPDCPSNTGWNPQFFQTKLKNFSQHPPILHC
jgi:hypothetical protein